MEFTAMKASKNFGKSLALPSKIEIKHDLMMMRLTDKLRSELRLNGLTSQEFSLAVKELVTAGEISADAANKIIRNIKSYDMRTPNLEA
jgi:hypothetical protein